MLSRIAESLYWIGRSVERAEGTARLLDVHYHVLLEDRHVDEATVCAALLGAMGVDADEAGDAPTASSVTALLTQDRDFAGSITASLAAAWENARGTREALSSEIWETLNATHQQMPSRLIVAGGPGRHDLFRWVKDRAAAVSGLVDTTMSRDEGWRFLVLGRSLERADMTARLLRAQRAEGPAEADWSTALRSCSAHEAYLRTYRGEVSAATAAEFLVLDRLFPRSVYSSLTTADDCISELDPLADRGGVDDEARRRLGRICAELEFLRADEVLPRLAQLLDRVQTECAGVHEAVVARYFRDARIIEWSV